MINRRDLIENEENVPNYISFAHEVIVSTLDELFLVRSSLSLSLSLQRLEATLHEKGEKISKALFVNGALNTDHTISIPIMQSLIIHI